MAKKNEFKPDKPRSGLLSKLYLTQKQRRSILKWLLYAALLVVLSVLQDVLLCRVRILGAATDLVPCGIFLICLAEGMERGSVFVLVASCLYLFSGTGAGVYTIVFLTFLAVFVTFFRQSFLQKGFAATMLCTAVGLIVYQLANFAIGVFLGLTTLSRVGSFCITGLMTMVLAPVIYPVVNAISTVGGEVWKE